MTYEELVDMGYSPAQINQILKGAKLGLDLTNLPVTLSMDTFRKIIEINPNIERARIALLADCLEKSLDPCIILNNKYTFNQAIQLYKGQVDGMDISVYDNPEYDSRIMENFRVLLKYNKDTKLFKSYVDSNKYCPEQLNELFLGIKKGLNISVYDDSKFRYQAMNVIRNGLEKGIDPEILKYAKGSRNNCKKLVNIALEAKVIDFDMLKFLKEGYDTGQITAIMHSNENIIPYINIKHTPDQIYRLNNIIESYPEFNLSLISNPELTPNQMSVIVQLSSKGLDVNEFLDKGFNLSQMNVIKQGITAGVNYKCYLDKKFSAEQMNEIFCGLRAGFPAETYADPDFTASQMKAIFNAYKINLEHPEKSIDPILITHKEYTYNQITHFAKVLRTGTLEEKLEIIKKHEELVKDKMQKQIEHEIEK